MGQYEHAMAHMKIMFKPKIIRLRAPRAVLAQQLVARILCYRSWNITIVRR